MVSVTVQARLFVPKSSKTFTIAIDPPTPQVSSRAGTNPPQSRLNMPHPIEYPAEFIVGFVTPPPTGASVAGGVGAGVGLGVAGVEPLPSEMALAGRGRFWVVDTASINVVQVEPTAALQALPETQMPPSVTDCD